MKSLITFSVACLLGVAATTCSVTASASSRTHQHAPAAAVPAPVHVGQRFATDAPLREGMGRIRQSVLALGRAEHGGIGAEQVALRVDGIERDVKFLIANCKLEPAADAALHGIIARLLQGAAALKADAKDVAAISLMRAAVADYAITFDHPVPAAD